MRRLRGLLGKGDLPSGHGAAPPGLVDPHGVHAVPDRRRLPRRRPDRRQDRPQPVAIQDRLVQGREEIVELRAGECERRGLALGDRVAWAARASDDTVAAAVVDIEGPRRGAVVLASRDQRYLKLALPARRQGDRRGRERAPPGRGRRRGRRVGRRRRDRRRRAVTEGAQGLASLTRARRPEATVVLVGEQAADRAPAGMQIYEKWDDTDGVVAAVEDAIERKAV